MDLTYSLNRRFLFGVDYIFSLPVLGFGVYPQANSIYNVRPQQILVVSEEALAQGCEEPRPQMYILDATDEKNPVLLSTFKVPDGDFCTRGGRFGPHQFAETKDGEIIGGSLLYVAYFNAGLRIVDIADPLNPGRSDIISLIARIRRRMARALGSRFKPTMWISMVEGTSISRIAPEPVCTFVTAYRKIESGFPVFNRAEKQSTEKWPGPLPPEKPRRR